MPTAELCFVLPAGSERVSGGNIYNAELLCALVALPNAPRVERLNAAEFRDRVLCGVNGVYCVDTLELAAALVLRDKHPGQRAVLVVHHLPSLEPGLDPADPALALERSALPLFDAFLVTSPFTRELLLERGVTDARILLVPPALPQITPPPPYDPPLRALVVANLIPRKGVLELLQALVTLLAPNVADTPNVAVGGNGRAAGAVLASQRTGAPAFTLDIVGRLDLDAAYAANVERIAASRGLREYVHLHGEVAYAEMGALYRGASLLVSAAKMETFGMALFEARAHGLPILALDGGYARQQFTDGENGRLFASVPALVAEMLALARDAGAMRAFASRARASALPGADSWDLAARRFVAELERCLP